MRWTALAMVSIGCVYTPPNDDGQFGEEAGARCEVVSRTPLGMQEVSPLGFDAATVLAYAAGEHADTLEWLEIGGSTPLTLTIAQAGDIEYLEQAVVTTGDGSGEEPALAPFCPNVLSMGVEIGFVTDDGAFAEQWLGVLTADTAELARFGRQLDGLAGTFDPWDHVPVDVAPDAVTAWLDGTVDAAGASGRIQGQATGEDAESDTAWAQSVDVGVFGTPEG